MARIKIVADKKTIIDADIGERTETLPELENYLKPGGPAEAWMRAILVLLPEHIFGDKPLTASVTTVKNGWDLRVRT